MRRATAFALFAIGTTMIAVSFDVPLSLKTGAALLTIMAVILGYFSLVAPSTDYRKTETWMLLDKQYPLPADRLQRIIGETLRDIYRRYARYSVGSAVLLWLMSLAIGGLR
ncbi:hypothetical protein [Oceanibaculum pacificum]|uniref:Uncharacterized protein n=1 Tax=Oceanibaculum pacificum TaxID=580166 RepID=A0A154VJ01_9PROT|nr:hypothetical protein [Oceanibaculum pacificum]KZD01349.1 hypothetical protein AUP43_13875 [Oceanibaculum pacificum]